MSFSDTFLVSEQEKVGWIYGLIWRRKAAIDYDDYRSEWTGDADRTAVFRPLLTYMLYYAGPSKRQGNSLNTSA